MSAVADSPQQGIQSIEVGAQVLRALEAGRGPLKLLAAARRDGIASSLHRMIYGMAAFGALVFGPDRGLVLAIGLAMPARLLVEGKADGLADALRSTAGQISAELGYRPA
jgi:DNA-binding IclR family transcriptional regulator